jgi:hypothetical protein
MLCYRDILSCGTHCRGSMDGLFRRVSNHIFQYDHSLS